MIAIDMRVEGIETVEQALARLDPLRAGELLNGLGRMIQEQTRRRITGEKTSPAGASWKKNRAGTSILYRSGTLARSIDYAVRGESVTVGSGIIYAAIHQFGGTITPKQAKRLVFRIGNRTIFTKKVTIPARPYLGISGENAEDILDQTARFLRAAIGGAR
jgi:phage gpG-like protein